MNEKIEFYKCPFCQEQEFDIYGLQLHLKENFCNNFGKYNSRNELENDKSKDE